MCPALFPVILKSRLFKRVNGLTLRNLPDMSAYGRYCTTRVNGMEREIPFPAATKFTV